MFEFHAHFFKYLSKLSVRQATATNVLLMRYVDKSRDNHSLSA